MTFNFSPRHFFTIIIQLNDIKKSTMGLYEDLSWAHIYIAYNPHEPFHASLNL